jgi:hypothetical protein
VILAAGIADDMKVGSMRLEFPHFFSECRTKHLLPKQAFTGIASPPKSLYNGDAQQQSEAM